MTGAKTNEREGTRAVLRHSRISPYKVRVVLDLVRGRTVQDARDIHGFIGSEDKTLELIPGAHYFEDSPEVRNAMASLVCHWARHRL